MAASWTDPSSSKKAPASGPDPTQTEYPDPSGARSSTRTRTSASTMSSPTPNTWTTSPVRSVKSRGRVNRFSPQHASIQGLSQAAADWSMKYASTPSSGMVSS